MSDVTITLPDGSRRSVPSGTPVRDLATAISPRLARAALAAAVGDRLVDLSYPLTADATVRLLTPESPEALSIYRHSTAHLLAAAVTALFPAVQCGIGPPTDEGFFYDFVVPRPFVPEDLERALALTADIGREIDFLAWELRPTALDDLGLTAALPRYVEEWSAHYKIKADFQTTGQVQGRLRRDAEVVRYSRTI